MMSEKRMLQIAVAIGSLVPIGAGLAGIVLGPALIGAGAGGLSDLDSHFRYLSGLLLAIGIGFASTIPRIETQGRRFRLLTFIVLVGGIARLASLVAVGKPSTATILAFVMELGVTPALAVWQWRVARRSIEPAAPARTPRVFPSS